ncbi:hypothetical protein [Desulfovibrio inopinatus]|uniref:hypothetical protein n=1 Tax=Desulfovibrio inopinatus TaxID=102109 RepID=UPI0003FF5BDC|nr:hypothetical protein [Desulfovibrio inopinatus]
MLEKILYSLLVVGMLCLMGSTVTWAEELECGTWTIVSLKAIDPQTPMPRGLGRILGQNIDVYPHEIRFGGRRCRINDVHSQVLGADAVAQRLGCSISGLGLIQDDTVTVIETGCSLLGLSTIYAFPDSRRAFVVEGHVAIMFPAIDSSSMKGTP